MKKKQCECGSNDLASVSAKLKNNQWVYTDRNGKERKREPLTGFHEKHQ